MNKKMLLLLLAVIAGISVSANEILYTSIDESEIDPEDTEAFDANIISNTYADGQGRIVFDGDVTTIDDRAFSGCCGLTSVVIPNSVTSIGDFAFSGCSGLAAVAIPNSVTWIGQEAFLGCDNLASVSIPESVTSIGDEAFYGCNLTSVTIPESVNIVGSSPFQGCSGLTAFYGKYASTDNRCLIIDGTLNSFASAGLTAYAVPESVTTIGNSSFAGCSNLASVTMPESVVAIGDGAFVDCSGLTTVTIPGAVTSIGESAFGNCSGLTALAIPEAVASIGEYAFVNCSGLTALTVDNNDPANIALGEDVFCDVPTSTCVLYVPIGSKELYQNADQWQDFAVIEEFTNP